MTWSVFGHCGLFGVGSGWSAFLDEEVTATGVVGVAVLTAVAGDVEVAVLTAVVRVAGVALLATVVVAIPIIGRKA